jgi:hypothetical protein
MVGTTARALPWLTCRVLDGATFAFQCAFSENRIFALCHGEVVRGVRSRSPVMRHESLHN